MVGLHPRCLPGEIILSSVGQVRLKIVFGRITYTESPGDRTGSCGPLETIPVMQSSVIFDMWKLKLLQLSPWYLPGSQ